MNPAVIVPSEVCSLFLKMWFRLQSWISNSRDILEKSTKSGILYKVVSLACDPLPVVRTLGVCRDTEQDILGLQSHLDYKPDTKFGVLASVATVFDPLGLLSPSTLVARKIYQHIRGKGKV